MYAFDLADLLDRTSPTNAISDYLLNVFVVECGVGFMSGLEVEDLAVAACEGATATEYFAAIEPADEDNFVGIRNIEGFAVHFFIFEKESVLYALCDGMVGLYDPDAFTGMITPLQVTGGAHELSEDLGVVAGMENHETHTAENSCLYAVNDFVAYSGVTHMSPPNENVGVCKDFFCQAVLFHVERGGTYLNIVTFENGFQITVNAARVDFGNERIAFFVKIFIPNRNFHVKLPPNITV